MIRILNVISGLNNAGTEAVVMNYYRNIDRSKIQFDFLVLDTASNLYYEKEISDLGGKVYKIPPFSRKPVKNMIERKRFFKTHKYDIVEVHSPSALRYAYCKLAKKSGAKVIFHIHNTANDESVLVKFARKQLFKYCDEIVTCSQYAAKSVLGKEADKVIYNAVEPEKYLYKPEIRSNLRDKLSISEDVCVIGNIGRFSEQKNQDFLIRTFCKVLSKSDGFRLLLKGFGERREQLVELAKSLHVDNKVIFADETYSASELYNIFDIFALPSKYEGLPVVMVEAQLNGLLPIVSDRVTEESSIFNGASFLKLDEDLW